MKTLIIFDSFFGNTEKVAQSIGKQFNSEELEIHRINEVKPENLKGLTMLIIGSPTRGFKPTAPVAKFIKENGKSLAGLNFAVFDTRIDLTTIKSGISRFIVKKGGYAANSMAKNITKEGANLVVPAEGFLVSGEEGPLCEGEIIRAEKWGKTINDWLSN